jgi:hypothetical protein
MKYFCMDAHISVIADLKNILSPSIEIVDWCISGHAWVMSRKQDTPDIINATTFMRLNMTQIQSFQARYDTFLRTFDGFIVCHVPTFAMIYEKYNRPILMLNSCRYDLPFCMTKDVQMADQWNKCIQRLHTKQLLTLVSNNLADQRYTELGCGIRPLHIPSLCLYTQTTYTPTRPTFLCYSGSLPFHPLVTSKPQRYEWSDIVSFQGVIHFPYEVSTMSLFEHFSAGCPLFFPSKTYLKSNPNIQSISAYWGNQIPKSFQEMTTPDGWIELADMYSTFQSPNTHYFDSIEELFHQLETFKYVDDRESRRQYVDSVKQKWKRLMFEIQTRSFWTQSPRHMCYNRLPLLANIVYDLNYQGSGVSPQHTYPYRDTITFGDIVFVKTDLLGWFLKHRQIPCPITLVTGVSDKSPTLD